MTTARGAHGLHGTRSRTAPMRTTALTPRCWHGGEGAAGDRPDAPDTPTDLADPDDYLDGAADSPFGAQSETSLPSRSDRSGRRTRRGSRGGSRRRGLRAQRGDAQAPDRLEQSAPEAGDALAGPIDLSESEQSADLAVAAQSPDPFGAALQGSGGGCRRASLHLRYRTESPVRGVRRAGLRGRAGGRSRWGPGTVAGHR